MSNYYGSQHMVSEDPQGNDLVCESKCNVEVLIGMLDLRPEGCLTLNDSISRNTSHLSMTLSGNKHEIGFLTNCYVRVFVQQ